MLAEKVKNFITENGLLSKDESVLVAFSGGADSMCLLHILKNLSYKVYAAHLNHGLRGKESERDEMVAQAFCFKHGIPYFSAHRNIAEISEEQGVSLETAGRNERYAFFRAVAEENGIDKIATAHNKNDNAETLLMHILRGTGTDGLSGIPKKRGNIIRPLLSCARSEIEEYCLNHSLCYVTDSTNLKNIYTRNKIRIDLIPQLENYNANIISSLTNLCELSLVDRDYFKDITDSVVSGKTSLEVKDIISLHDAVLLRVIMRLCENCQISPEFNHIRKILTALKSNSSGKRFDLPGGFIEISCGKISACKHKETGFCHEITPKTELTIGSKYIKASASVLSDTYIIIPEDKKTVVRSRLPGDKIKVRGMTKKVSDIFIDKKIPQVLRDEIPILTVDGEILYILGIEKSDFLTKYAKNDKTFVLNISDKEYTNE